MSCNFIIRLMEKVRENKMQNISKQYIYDID